LGYVAVDNLPLSLLPSLVLHYNLQENPQSLAVGVDVRTHDFQLEKFLEVKNLLLTIPEITPYILFLDADDDVLARRYGETRRTHPMGEETVLRSIQEERLWMHPIRALADEVIDSSHLKTAKFTQILRERYALTQGNTLKIHVLSFAFKFGSPRDADLVFDMRFLDNPHYERNLKPLTGQDKDVQDYLRKDESWEKYWESLTSLLRLSIDGFKRNGRSYVTIAFGCTGGQHRSVFMAEEIKQWLQTLGNVVMVDHRDLPRKETT
jgi:RNase adapter protein RapZ